MFYALMGTCTPLPLTESERFGRSRETNEDKGTGEYVGLILLVSLLMVGMVAAMKGFNRSLS